MQSDEVGVLGQDKYLVGVILRCTYLCFLSGDMGDNQVWLLFLQIQVSRWHYKGWSLLYTPY